MSLSYIKGAGIKITAHPSYTNVVLLDGGVRLVYWINENLYDLVYAGRCEDSFQGNCSHIAKTRAAALSKCVTAPEGIKFYNIHFKWDEGSKESSIILPGKGPKDAQKTAEMIIRKFIPDARVTEVSLRK